MRFRAFIVARGSDMDTGIFADEQRWFECACTMVFLPENGADDHDVTM